MGSGLRVVLGIRERIAGYHHGAAVAQEDGLTVGLDRWFRDDGGADGRFKAIIYDTTLFDAAEFQGGATGSNEGIAGDDEAFNGRDSVLTEGVVSARFDRRAMRTRIHVGKGVVGDGDVAGDAADQAHAGVQRNVATHASEGATAHGTRAGHDKQALEAVFPAAVLYDPTCALVVEPLGLRFGEGSGVLIEGELEIFERCESGFTEKDAGLAMDEAQAVAWAGIFKRWSQ